MCVQDSSGSMSRLTRRLRLCECRKKRHSHIFYDRGIYFFPIREKRVKVSDEEKSSPPPAVGSLLSHTNTDDDFRRFESLSLKIFFYFRKRLFVICLPIE